MRWLGRIWAGPLSGRVVVAVCGALAAFAILVSGSIVAAISSLFDSLRASDRISWQTVQQAFLADITGSPGLFLSVIKTLFAVVVAFAVLKAAGSLRGDLSLNFAGLTLSGAQTGAMIWCLVFALVKLL